MAGAEKVIRPPAARRLAVLILLLLAGLPAGEVVGQDRTVMLVEHPEGLEVLNRYQQAATPGERARLRPWAPLVILKPHEAFPDGYTTATQVSAEGEVFYLIETPSGPLAGAAAAGKIMMISHAQPLGDTARTTAGVPAELVTGGPHTIPAGTLVERLFRTGKTYVRVLRGDGAYCWIAPAHASLLRPYHLSTASAATPPSAVEASVRAKLQETNAVLRSLYRVLNSRTGKDLAPPVWGARALPGALLCELSGAAGAAFAGSTRFLAKDIENSLLGSGCRVETDPGRITVLLP